ncbi:RNA polymerase II holoenzyme/mediator subunit [Scheffersomyces spartinae]|uniref:Mediator of RNA polymerase II transcription subunit 19 n=1 Tax=Scheffersomyces spartinae TaxID=45513 RepID=A0A9P7VB83_9ASCO|nr:RNA polymerase II holoenzyme/mediator subunit [Scheffersomyces spartinae]KAG7194677.1 RNA polymerase II holoenzyme/mediator subunit [Scheffersomyces spartinae]
MTKRYKPSEPTPLDNLLSNYGLEPIAESLARTKVDGSKGVKLRKSYKNHILDLVGKHQIANPKPIQPGLLDPNLDKTPDMIKEIDINLLRRALKFDKTPVNGIAGFSIADLAIGDLQSIIRGDDSPDDDNGSMKKGKRKKKIQEGGDIKRQHI